MKFLIILGALFTASIIPQAQANDWTIGAELKEASAKAIYFGESTAISRDGKTALVTASLEACAMGSYCGAAYVYASDTTGWHRQAKLVASDSVANLRLGGFSYDDNTVALSGDGNTALVGTDPNGLGTGAVYIFVRNGENWSQQQKLTAIGSIGFGRSVAISDDGKTAVVGDTLSLFYNSSARIAHVFEKTENKWEEKAQLTGSRIGYTDYRVSTFGKAVAISGDGGTILVGSPGYPTDLQEAYIFKKTKQGWSEQAILSPADKNPLSNPFGVSTALSFYGDTAVVGSYSGPSYVYRSYSKFGDWREEAKLGANITNRGGFGFSLDIDDRGDNIVVGAWSAGAIFMFHRHRNDDGSLGKVKWVPELLLSKNYSFGSSVAISGNAKTILASYERGLPCTLEDGYMGMCTSVNVLNHR